jgi:uncharacterized protein YkuJ
MTIKKIIHKVKSIFKCDCDDCKKHDFESAGHKVCKLTWNNTRQESKLDDEEDEE